jgi:phosphoserine phosphatase
MATASFDFCVDALAAQLGFDRVVCTRSAWSERQTLTGQIAGANCYGQEKVRRLQEHFGDERPGWLVHGYSDHHSDIPFLSWVDRPVAVNPTRKMRGIARRMGIEIVAWDA